MDLHLLRCLIWEQMFSPQSHATVVVFSEFEPRRQQNSGPSVTVKKRHPGDSLINPGTKKYSLVYKTSSTYHIMAAIVLECKPKTTAHLVSPVLQKASSNWRGL